MLTGDVGQLPYAVVEMRDPRVAQDFASLSAALPGSGRTCSRLQLIAEADGLGPVAHKPSARYGPGCSADVRRVAHHRVVRLVAASRQASDSAVGSQTAAWPRTTCGIVVPQVRQGGRFTNRRFAAPGARRRGSSARNQILPPAGVIAAHRPGRPGLPVPRRGGPAADHPADSPGEADQRVGRQHRQRDMQPFGHLTLEREGRGREEQAEAVHDSPGRPERPGQPPMRDQFQRPGDGQRDERP